MAKGAIAKVAAATSGNVKKTVPPQLTPFQPGNKFGKGRPKGSRNKLGEEFLTALQADFQAHGAETIVKVREDRPHEYLKVVASILPKELNVRTDALNEMSDDDLAAMLDAVRSAILAGAYAQAGKRDEASSRH